MTIDEVKSELNLSSHLYKGHINYIKEVFINFREQELPIKQRVLQDWEKKEETEEVEI